jgi:predicted dehydrogenase
MKVLIIGFGSIACKHYNALYEIDSKIEFYALRNNQNSKKITNVKSIYNKDEVLNFKPFDFVIISNPSFLHSDAIKTALQLNCPLFIEKPLFHKLTNDNIIDQINNKKILTYVACNLRFLDALKFTKDNLIPQIKINEVNIYCGSFLPNWRNNVDYKNCYSSESKMGGGVHLDLIHEIDYAYWLFGKPKHVSKSLKSNSTLEINAIDYANYLFDYNNFSVNIVLNYYRRDYKRYIELVAEEGTFLIDLVTNSVYSYKENKTIFESKQKIANTYMNQMNYFLEFIKNRKQDFDSMNDINEAFEVLKICLHDVKR